MHAEDLAIDDGREAEIVEDFGAVAPDRNWAVLSQALVIEAVDLGDLTRLMVAADERDAIGIADLKKITRLC